MKRFISFILAFVFTAGGLAYQTDADTNYSSTIENCYSFINNGDGRYATADSYYSYDNFVENLDNSGAFAFWELSADVVSDLSCQPSVEDYTEGLSNVIALQDIQNSSDLSAQQSLDDLKNSEDLASDLNQICLDGLTLYTDLHGSKMEKKVTDICNKLVDVAESGAEYYQSMNNLYNQITTFAEYDRYLSEIEQSSNGKLQKAASQMRDGLSAILEYNIDTALEYADPNYIDINESLFSNIDRMIDKYADKYDNPALSCIKLLKDSYKLGTEGALLLGNFFLGTENVAKRVRELRVLNDISDATVDSVLRLEYEFLLAYENGYATEEMVNTITEMLDHLYDTRRRGEYCLYSTITSDSKLLSLLASDGEVEDWYKKITDFMNDKEWYLKMIYAGPEVIATHHYYVFGPGVASSWDEAKAYCESLGGHLATIGSKYENDLVFNLMLESGLRCAYFGLTDSGSEGKWRTVNGEPVIFLNWGGSEPNNERDKEHYAMFYYKFPDGSWNDGDFGWGTVGGGTAFVCEWDVDPDTVDINTLIP